MQGYVAACLRALGRRATIDLFVVHLDFDDLPYQEPLLAGIPNRKFRACEPNRDIPDLVVRERPDVVFVCGWFYAAYRRLVRVRALDRARFLLGMDTPWTGSWRQRVNQVRLRPFIGRMDRVVVAGARTREFARRLGVAPDRILPGLYGFDHAGFEAAGRLALDPAVAWPRRFLFAGRYAREKGLDVLLDAYDRYRAAVSDPWPLDCCGTGPEAARLGGRPGVSDLGYLQPSELPRVFAAHGAFVMPSLEEPWGVAIAEAAATGLPLVCSDRCGAADDVLRHERNGLVVPAGDVPALAEALAWIDRHEPDLPAMGRRSRELAAGFSAEAWADRMQAVFSDVLAASRA